jgi:hypothetical protein
MEFSGWRSIGQLRDSNISSRVAGYGLFMLALVPPAMRAERFSLETVSCHPAPGSQAIEIEVHFSVGSWHNDQGLLLLTQTMSASARESRFDAISKRLIYKWIHTEGIADMLIQIIMSVSDFVSRSSC